MEVASRFVTRVWF